MLAVILTENLEVRWQKSFKESDKLLEIEASKTIALSAFFLTTLPTAVAQKTLVEGIWASGAHTLVLIDHDTPEGFKAIAHAREHLLELSKSEAENPEFASSQPAGCHVVAPVSSYQAICIDNSTIWFSVLTINHVHYCILEERLSSAVFCSDCRDQRLFNVPNIAAPATKTFTILMS